MDSLREQTCKKSNKAFLNHSSIFVFWSLLFKKKKEKKRQSSNYVFPVDLRGEESFVSTVKTSLCWIVLLHVILHHSLPQYQIVSLFWKLKPEVCHRDSQVPVLNLYDRNSLADRGSCMDNLWSPVFFFFFYTGHGTSECEQHSL